MCILCSGYANKVTTLMFTKKGLGDILHIDLFFKPILPLFELVSSMDLLTKHVKSANGIGLECFDGVIHVVGRRGWRSQVINLVHCEEQKENESSNIEPHISCSKM